MKERLKDLIYKNFQNKKIEKSNKFLLQNRKEVDINANGTQGYVVKHGPNAGKALAHRAVKSTNNW